MIRHSLHLFKVFRLGQQAQPLRMEHAAGGVEGLPVLFAQFSPKGVKSDDESTSVSLKLNFQDTKSVKSNYLLTATTRTLSRKIHFQSDFLSFLGLCLIIIQTWVTNVPLASSNGVTARGGSHTSDNSLRLLKPPETLAPRLSAK